MSDSITNGLQENHGHEILNDAEMMTNEKWQAIINNDAAYNNQFFYAVKTTGIFCKLKRKPDIHQHSIVSFIK